MGGKFVGFNRFLHTVLGKLACAAFACIVFVTLLLVAGENAWTDRLEPLAPELLLTLFVFVLTALTLRFYVRFAVNFACDWFPHDASIRLGMMYLFDLGVLFSGVCLLLFAANRLPESAGSWAWWRMFSVLLAGAVFVFDAVLFLCGLLPHEDVYAVNRVPAYQRKLRESERIRRRREAEYAQQMQKKEMEREPLWNVPMKALPADSARLYLLNKQG